MYLTHQRQPKRHLLAAIAATLLLLAANAVQAQTKPTMRIVSFTEDPFDRSGDTWARRVDTTNGEAFALVKVTSAQPDDDLNAYIFAFGSLYAEKGELHDDTLYLYVQKGAKQVSVTRQGYQSVQRQQLGMTLEPAHNYRMILSTTGPQVRQQLVHFKVTPADAQATVIIKPSTRVAEEINLGVTDENGEVASSQPFGTYTYRITSRDYRAVEGRFTLQSTTETHTETVSLEANYADVTITAPDSRTEIFLDGQPRGRGRWQGRLRERQEVYTVESRQDNYKPAQTYFKVERGKAQTVTLPALTPITGSLAVVTRPLGATVEVDGKEVGVTPVTVNDLIVGTHRVTLRKANYQPVTTEVTIREQETSNLSQQLSDVARMTIATSPSGAHLFINGQDKGLTPFAAEMASGDYDLRITHPHYSTLSRRVHLDSANPTLRLSLQRQRLTPTQAYANVAYNVGSLSGIGASVGAYVSNINVELSALFGSSESDPIYWNYTGTTALRPYQTAYKAKAYSLRAGYGLIFGTSLRLTPQAGATIVAVSGTDVSSKANAVAATVGVRADYALIDHVGLFLAPEVAVPLSKSSIYESLSQVSSTIKGWSSGFGLRIGVSVFLP